MSEEQKKITNRQLQINNYIRYSDIAQLQIVPEFQTASLGKMYKNKYKKCPALDYEQPELLSDTEFSTEDTRVSAEVLKLASDKLLSQDNKANAFSVAFQDVRAIRDYNIAVMPRASRLVAGYRGLIIQEFGNIVNFGAPEKDYTVTIGG